MNTPRYDIIGQALADTSRARMLCELMEGRAYTNKELASAAGVSPPTATAHLRVLQDAGLVVAEKSGRCVYHRLVGADVAHVLEQLATIAPMNSLYSAQKRKAGDLALARSCYDHLAGPLSVTLVENLAQRGVLNTENGSFHAIPSEIWQKLGVTLPDRPTKRAFARPCLDWTERKPHIAGPLGQQFLSHAFKQDWIRRNQHARGIKLTGSGIQALRQILGLDPETLMTENTHA
ncbi:MAG: ArsR/SmtB family transcription factor [Paracoccaceae bacterium]